MTWQIAARNSPLSRAQVAEVLELLRARDPSVAFESTWVMSAGDMDKHTSLRTLGKTDFFTREIDELVLSCRVRLGIHSAKDLPEPLADGLCVAWLTPAIDARDALVLREGKRLEDLPAGAWIATSSERREEAARALRSDLRFQDLRGTIAERLAMLTCVDGVVIAEAALIRLGLTHLNRLYLPGPTVRGQGQLAVVCRKSDWEARAHFVFGH